MHAIERPHLPRVGFLALGAVLLAITVLLLAASRVEDIGVSSTSESTRAASVPAATAATINEARPVGSSAFTNAFASPFHVALPWPKATGR